MIRPTRTWVRLARHTRGRCDLGHIAGAILAMALLLSAAAVLAQENDKPIIGQPSVIDAGEKDVDGRRLRLYAIQAPGIRQRCRAGSMPWFCGANSAKALRELIGERNVRCEVRERDAKKQILAVCFVGNIEINRELVRLGMAQIDRRLPDYGLEENEARASRRGIWQGVLMPEG